MHYFIKQNKFVLLSDLYFLCIGSRKAMELLSEDGFYFITFFHIIPSVQLFGFSNLW